MDESIVGEHVNMVMDCARRARLLNAWEEDFVEGLSVRLGGGGDLDSDQVETLGEIWDRVTEDG